MTKKNKKKMETKDIKKQIKEKIKEIEVLHQSLPEIEKSKTALVLSVLEVDKLSGKMTGTFEVSLIGSKPVIAASLIGLKNNENSLKIINEVENESNMTVKIEKNE